MSECPLSGAGRLAAGKAAPCGCHDCCTVRETQSPGFGVGCDHTDWQEYRTCWRFWRALAEELGQRLHWHVRDSGHVYPERELSEDALAKLEGAKGEDRE